MRAHATRQVYRAVWVPFFFLVPLLTAPAQEYGLPGPRPAVSPYLGMPATPPQPAGAWTTELAFPNLTFSNPVFMMQAPRSNRLYVCEREGRIYSFQNDPGTSGKTLVLDLSAQTQGWDDCGLMSMAFHPQFGLAGSANRGYFYIYHQYSQSPVAGPNRPPNTTPTFERIARFTIPDGQFTADPLSELVLVSQHDRNIWHNGGCLLFHPVDGFLYFTIGDEGNADDSYNVTQTITDKLMSGVFRIDVDMKGGSVSHPIRRQPQSYPGRPSSTANYFIPNDNPWQDAGGGVLEEFYAVGARSPHRLTHDPVRNLLILGDVGQGAWEEVDLIEKGKNYQWAFGEGKHAGPKPRPATIIGVEAPPIYEFAHGASTFQGNCIIGGYIYRGAQHAASLGGLYIFGDNTYGRIWSMDLNTSPPTVAYLTNMPSGTNYTGLSSFGVDASGELYLLKMNHTGPGQILKLGRAGTSGAPFPPVLTQTGAFSDVAILAPATGLIPYSVGSPLWSDGAHKLRWMALPFTGGGDPLQERIQFAPTGEWLFPSGTVFVKHFELTVNEITGARRRLETRLLVRSPGSGVYGVTYRWRADGSDADLLTGGLDEDVAVVTAQGTVNQTWHYPSSIQCLTCHNAAAQHVLGVKTRQLNNELLYTASGVTDNQLRSLNHLGLFQPAISETDIPSYDQLVPIDDATASLEHRVRSYLDANCAVCHRPGNVQALFDARFDTPLSQQGIVDGPVADPLGIDGAGVVRPKDRWRSILYVRDSSNNPSVRMPPLARNVADATAVAAITEWIDSLPGTPSIAPPSILPVEDSFEDSVLVSIAHPDPLATVRYTLDGSDPTDLSPAYSGPFTLSETTVVSARAFLPGFLASVLARTQFLSSLAGLQGEYYDDMNLATLALTRVDPTVDFNWGGGSPDPSIGADTFSVRWTGQVEALFSETYTFYTVSDDGIRLWIDGQPVINNWTDHASTENSGTLPLLAGQRYAVRLEFYENGGDAAAQLLWSSPSTPKQVIPQVRLFSGAKPSNPDLQSLACVKAGSDASLSWSNRGTYDEVRVYRNGTLAASLPGSAVSATIPLESGRSINLFRVASVASGIERGGQSCSLLSLSGAYAAAIDEHFTPAPSPAVLQVNCNAVVRNGALELTPPLGTQAGSAFFLAPHDDGEFIAEFDFNFTEPSAPCADGVALIVNTGGPTAICGAAGGAMGFRTADNGTSVFPGFAVIFDTWQNPGEVSHNWVGIVDLQQGGTAQAAADVPEEFCGNGPFHATIVASQGDIVVLLENAGLGMGQRQIVSYSLPGFTAESAFFGFTGGTGGSWARQAVDNFRLRIPAAPPVAAFSSSPLTGVSPLSVQFTSTSQGTITTYAWDFGDGGKSALASPLHIFAAPGTYSVSLRVVGPAGEDTLLRTGLILVRAPAGKFTRGDANGDGGLDVSDAVFVLFYAFSGRVSTNCPDALDLDDNGAIEITDAVYLLEFLFRNGPPPKAPYPAAGADATSDPLPICQRGI